MAAGIGEWVLSSGVAEIRRERQPGRTPESWGRDGKSYNKPVLFLRYGMRYMAKVLKTALEKKFPNATEGDIYKASVCPFCHLQDPPSPKETG